MQNKFLKIFIILLLFAGNAMAYPNTVLTNASLSGKVTDQTTGETLPGVSIYFPDLKTGTVTKSDGTYLLEKLPAAKLLVQVSFVGYKLTTRQVDLATTSTLDFSLEESITEISEVVVTGQSAGVENTRTPSPIAIVPREHLLQNTSTNIIDALANTPGVSQVTTGAGISKPVIRGLGYNRVVVVNDGIRQEGQQWGDEHGIEIDQYGVNHIEILKGPASLAYGSDAMAGVINMISAPTLPSGTIKGTVISNYQSNNGLIGYSANIAGNKNGVIWDARYSNKMAHAYKNAYDGWVYNSGFREDAASTMLGLNRSWGFSHLNLSVYQLEPGIIEGERDYQTGKFIKIIVTESGEESEAFATSDDFHSYHPGAPFQKIAHYKAVWNSRFFIRKSNLQTTFGFQQNHRKEFESADEYGLYFLLNTLNYDVKYVLPEMNGWKITTGINGMWQNSKNKGSEFLVPAYKLFDAGVFTVINKQIGDIDFSGGLRFDQRTMNSHSLYIDENDEATRAFDPQAVERFAAFDRTFNGFSGSLGASWQISQTTFTKLNISKGFRTPNIAELGSNGIHEGTLRYEIGNQELKPESSLQFDWVLGLNTKHVSVELDLFANTVDHFIFSHKLNMVSGADSLINDTPVFKFTDGKAHLYGGELKVDIHPHPLDWLHIENTFSLVNATLKNQPDTAHYLPLTPASRWQSEVKAEFGEINHFLENGYLKFGIENTWKQNHFYAAYGTETATPGYALLNIGAGVDLVNKHNTLCSLFFSINNLTDVAYQSHLSRLKYAGMNYATGRTGIYNMGRNVSFKLLIPIGFSE